MTDIASLGIEISTKGHSQAIGAMGAIETGAKKAETATGKMAATIERNTRRVEQALGFLKVAASAAFAAFSVQALISYTDRWTDLNSRVVQATGSIAAGAIVMERLSDMARRTYSSLDQTAEGFLLNANSFKELGYSTQVTLDFVEALNNGLVVSGAKGERAASVMNALSKALAAGKLSGDNLNTVLETGGRVTQAIAAGLGVTTLELRRMGAEGKLTTSKVIDALVSQLQELRDEADAMPATISDALGQLGNSVLKTVGLFDQLAGGSSRVAEAILFLADNMHIVVGAVAGLATAITTLMLPALGAMALALATNPFFLAAAAVGVLAGAIAQFAAASWEAERKAHQFNGSIRSNADALEKAATASGIFRTNLRAQIEMQKIAADAALAEADAQLKASKAKLTALRAEAEGRPFFNAFGIALAQREVDQNLATSLGLDSAASTLELQLAKIEELEKRLGGGKTDVPSLPDKASEKVARKYDDLIRSSQQFIAQQQLEASALGMTEQEANRLRYTQELLNKAANDNIKLTPQMRTELEGYAAAMAAAEEQTRRLTEIYNFGKDTFKGFFSDLKSGLKEGQGFWESFGNAAANALDKIADKFLDMALDGIWDTLFGAFSGKGGGSSAGGIGGILGGLFGWLFPNAKGGVYASKSLSAYSGQVVNTPTVFAFAQGAGLMGEAGPEAIMPLKRTASGALGVQVANQNQGNDVRGYGDINITNHISVPPGTSPETAPAIAREVTKELKRQLPDAIKDYNRNPYRRAG
ncbi:hypothetical protein GCM10011321_14590 [Youhaiella tibetensis]|nr:tape measure protein [Youhaiella tibetensis]GGF24301.1 hypothetical protein GCM10011321_14590 [Youhaiella tibetensis]